VSSEVAARVVGTRPGLAAQVETRFFGKTGFLAMLDLFAKLGFIPECLSVCWTGQRGPGKIDNRL
jgi:hypothetical protein